MILCDLFISFKNNYFEDYAEIQKIKCAGKNCTLYGNDKKVYLNECFLSQSIKLLFLYLDFPQSQLKQ